MLFRKEEFDTVKVLNARSEEALGNRIRELGEEYIFIDLQFSTNIVNQTFFYYALCLLRKK